MNTELAKFDQLKAGVTVLISPIKSLIVKDEASMRAAQDVGRGIKAYLKRIEEVRHELVNPMNQRVKEINAIAKGIVEIIERDAEAPLKSQLLAYSKQLEELRQVEIRKQNEERRKEEQRILEERSRIEAEAALALKQEQDAAAALGMDLDPKETERKLAEEQARLDRESAKAYVDDVNRRKEIDSIRVADTRKTWTFEIEDLSQIPREFMTFDPKIAREHIRLGARNIPGLRIFQTTSVALGR